MGDLTDQLSNRPGTGEHFETEKLFARHRRYGSFDISDLNDLPHDLLNALSEGSIPSSHPERWAFLDTETTGLEGGTGTYAFLIGVGSIEPEGFRVRQFFMRDFGEEPSQLRALTEYLRRFDVLVTFNGKTFDQPLLETRYILSRQRPPFARMEHLDLLFGARRLWKLRLANCRLTHLEEQILGVERDGDVPGAFIPQIYFEYVRTGRAWRMEGIFHHNVLDILTLACLTALVPQAFRDPGEVKVRHGEDLIGLARWLLRSGREGEALPLMRKAVEIGLPDALLFRTIYETGLIEKKLSNGAAALAAFAEVANCPNGYRAKAYEELAKYYEHEERNFTMALEMTRCARKAGDLPALKKREERLLGKSQLKLRMIG